MREPHSILSKDTKRRGQGQTEKGFSEVDFVEPPVKLGEQQNIRRQNMRYSFDFSLHLPKEKQNLGKQDYV